nr:HAD-IIB family hydrolase [Vermiculatibacterium agrestimuris]
MLLGTGKFSGVLLATDFDDTYFPESGVLPRANLEAVEYFKAQGGLFTISTGRAHRTFSPFLSMAPVNVPVILSNGAQLYDFEKDEMVLETTLPTTIAADLAALVERHPTVSLEAYHGEEVYIWNPNRWTRHHLKKARTDAVECPILEMPQPWGKAILHQDRELLLPAQADILRLWPERYEAIFSNAHMLELTAKGSTKGGMVLELARRLGVEREHIYCAGDNQNDIPMLAVSAVPFAPANCAQEVKDWGAKLLPVCEEGAIAALIGELDRLYS